MTHTQKILGLAAVLAVVIATQAQAGGLGVPGDGFIQTFATWVQGLGFIIGLVGVAGWIGSMFDCHGLAVA